MVVIIGTSVLFALGFGSYYDARVGVEIFFTSVVLQLAMLGFEPEK
jgi:hypothetical protein